MIKDVNVPIRFKQHIKYNQDTNTLANGQLWMLWMADSGNCSTTPSTLSGIPQGSPTTGVVLRYDIQYFYYDN